MSSVALAPALEAAPATDHIVVLRNATWADYERLLAMRGDHSAPRIAYLEGTIEIMSPSIHHEDIKSLIGTLVEAWCLEHGVRFRTCGSWTVKEEPKERGVEPDECYVFGDSGSKDDLVRPDLAIEVIWTSGGLDKLEIYRKLGVREVWIWRKGRLTPYALRDEMYEEAECSEVLPGIDLAQLVRYLDYDYTSDAILGYVAALRG